MIKKLLTFFAVAAIALCVATPAYAASLSSAEQKVLDKFEDELDYWVKTTDFDKDHKQQYYTEAKNALLAVDLTDAACKEFEGVVDQVHQVFVKHNCKTRHELWDCYPEILPLINNVGAKYYNLHVTVSGHSEEFYANEYCEGHWAKVTYVLPGSTKASTVASTAKVVKQTGFDLTRTAMVTATSALVLLGAIVLSRKMHLFVR